jgi:hypothetical protein
VESQELSRTEVLKVAPLRGCPVERNLPDELNAAFKLAPLLSRIANSLSNTIYFIMSGANRQNTASVRLSLRESLSYCLGAVVPANFPYGAYGIRFLKAGLWISP